LTDREAEVQAFAGLRTILGKRTSRWYCPVRPFHAGSSAVGEHAVCGDYLVGIATELGQEQQIAETELREPWPAVVRDAAGAMNPARGAIIGLSIGLSFWLCFFLLTWLVLQHR
jgi:hypothetical protein